MPWDPSFTERSPMLQPLVRCAARLRACAQWPSREAQDALLRAGHVCNARGSPLRAVAPHGSGALSYEARVFERGELEVREREWHDLLNLLAWCAFPKAKAALNARHVAEAARERGGRDSAEPLASNRGRARDALTLFDESGAIVVSSDPELLDDLRAFRWKRLFRQRRERFCSCVRVYLFGHGLMEKALAPYVGMTAHAITLGVDAGLFTDGPEQEAERIDALAAGHIADAGAMATPRALAPLPLLGVPGWWAQNEEETFYDNAEYFRPARRRSR
jgi:hypothetical protein